MGYDIIHETVVTDVLNTIKHGVQWVDGKVKPKSPKVRTAGSIARATSGLTLVFPVICTDTLDAETATMIAKAIERKNISLLQMAFSAYNITNATDAITHLEKFHTNMDFDKLTVDKFMDIMDSIDESTATTYPSEVAMINEDSKRNCNFIMEDDINNNSILEFSQVTRYSQNMIIREEVTRRPGMSADDMHDRYHTGQNNFNTGAENLDDIEKWEDQQFTKERDAANRAHQSNMARDARRHDKEMENIKNANQTARDNASRQHDLDMAKDKRDFDAAQNDIKNKISASDDKRQYFASQLLSSDVKKANEMQPSLMIVNFYVNDRDRDLNIAQQIVAGVKSKLYPVASSDIVDKIITKVSDSDILLKLVKVSTREISFVKDFLLGLDDAKLDALSKSRKGSGSAMFNALERRAIKGKIRKTLKLDNSAKAISTMVISVEEAEQLKKYNNIDMANPKIAATFMAKMNLLYFVIVDTTGESLSILVDGESSYEELSFSALERESGDGAYKKVVKLMTSITN